MSLFEADNWLRYTNYVITFVVPDTLPKIAKVANFLAFHKRQNIKNEKKFTTCIGVYVLLKI